MAAMAEQCVCHTPWRVSCTRAAAVEGFDAESQTTRGPVTTSMVTVEEVMTRRVITVRPDTPVHEAARLMVANRVSGLPVIDQGKRVVGMVSDGDLIFQQRRRRLRPWWRSFFERGERLAREYRKSVGVTVGDVMTRPALVISPVFGIETAAAILDNCQIRRLPVVRDGQLVGVVSRGDLIKALAGSTVPPPPTSLMAETGPRTSAPESARGKAPSGGRWRAYPNFPGMRPRRRPRAP